MTVTRFTALCLVTLALGLTVGCKRKSRRHSGSNDSVTVQTTLGFAWEADVFDYSGTESYEWENKFEDGVVEFEAFDFAGVVTVDIYDHFDQLVYSRTFVGKGGDRYEFDVTDFGDPGLWLTVITTEHVDGFLTLTID